MFWRRPKTEDGQSTTVETPDAEAAPDTDPDPDATDTPGSIETPVIVQGSLEESNVQPVLEISHMLDVMRAYQTTANLTQSQEELKRNAIDKLGNVAN